MNTQCTTCTNATGYYVSKNQPVRSKKKRHLYDDSGSQQYTCNNNVPARIVFETGLHDATFHPVDAVTEHYVIDKNITLGQLVIDIDQSFGADIPLQGVFVQYARVYSYVRDRCRTGKPVGWVVNIFCPRKEEGVHSKDLIATLWTFVVLTNGQLLLKSVESPAIPDNGSSCGRDRRVESCCSDSYSLEINKRNIPVYDCNAKLLTHNIYGPMDIVGVCGDYTCKAGCGSVNGTLCYDGSYSGQFYNDLVSASCSGERKCYPLSLRYEICLMDVDQSQDHEL